MRFVKPARDVARSPRFCFECRLSAGNSVVIDSGDGLTVSEVRDPRAWVRPDGYRRMIRLILKSLLVQYRTPLRPRGPTLSLRNSNDVDLRSRFTHYIRLGDYS
jgi:hypothetical protein